ncbi:helix-turn-helix transcriptional regulator [Leifsonia sp. F6_8S_P_1B]|uniref:Helix-turn-helix transcriptional regulator n=1 Tax=Leifsonia williamsii TaxID=3035919 RepID=A0ABT8KGZ1_9MICO|nr:helix-turn-helix transcriptional regulator [Leifsonia williamsii]MDN4616452.1 helix-turn-helix transcriptional regulator [Leifsonia williamsii]
MEQGKHTRALAAEIRAERAASGLTQAQLADKAGINYETLKLLLKGTRPINISQIVQLAQAFDISPADLVERAMDRASRMSDGSTTPSTENKSDVDPRGMSAGQLDQLRQGDVALAAHPNDPESEQDEQYQ